MAGSPPAGPTNHFCPSLGPSHTVIGRKLHGGLPNYIADKAAKGREGPIPNAVPDVNTVVPGAADLPVPAMPREWALRAIRLTHA